jgi:outer membrane protein assembly factor BamB
VMAIDALRDSTGREDVVLWRQDLSSSLVGSGTMQTSANAITRPWGPTRYVFSENLRPVGSIGPITSVGFFYQKTQELTCVDPLTGETIWTRSGMEPGSDIFGDQDYLFVASPNREDAMVFRAADGKELGRRFVGSRQDRWITAGRHVLCCQMVDQQLVVRWFDAWDGKDVWRREFTAGSQCSLLARDALAVLEMSGKFTLLNLADGSQRFETQLAAEPQLARLYIIPGRDTCVVLTSRNETNEDATVARYRPWSPLGSDLCPEINGRVYALDVRTGQPLWPTAAEVAKLCCPLDQPAESPAVVFFQNVQPSSSATSPRPAIKGAVLCMDKRDGRQLLFDSDLAMIRTYAVTAQPQDRKITVNSNSKQLILMFTDEPVEKQSPLQFKAEPPKPDALQQVGKIAWGILQVIAKPKDPGGAEDAQQAPAAETPPPADQPAEKKE